MAETTLPRITVAPAADAPGAPPTLIDVQNLSLFYGAAQALKNISLGIGEKVVIAFIGPSGCGKSTLLRCFNRMNDLIDNVRIQGAVKIAEQDIYSHQVDVIELRKRVG